LTAGAVVLAGVGLLAWAGLAGSVRAPSRGPMATSLLRTAPVPLAGASARATAGLGAPAVRWTTLTPAARLALARRVLGPGSPNRLTVAPRDLVREAVALTRLRSIAQPGRTVDGLLGLAARLVDPQALVQARHRALVDGGLRGMRAVGAADVVGVPDLRLGTPKRGTWYFDLGPSQQRVTIRGGRVVAVDDVSSPAFAGAALGPGSPAVSALPDRLLAPSGPDAGAVAAQQALSMVGTPYVWGGESPGGFDCSGLVRWAYKRAGLLAPRVAAEQAQVGRGVPRDQLRPGDVLFFADATGYVHHDGIYVGGGRFVHAPHTGTTVQVESISNPRYASQYAGARRYADTA
jgi:cell wall-associated NlpC family hydrolase